MKELLTLYIFLFSVNNLFALDAKNNFFAVTKSIQGTVFKEVEGKTTFLKMDEKINIEDEIFTELGASVSIFTKKGTMYYLSGGSHIKFKKEEVNLLNGQIYVQSKNNTNILLYTANGLIEFNKGEVILTYEPDKSKTQVLVVDGNVKFANKLERDYFVNIGNGQFSFVNNSEEYLYPRNPTNIGNSSFVKMKTAFSNIKSLETLDHFRLEEFTGESEVQKVAEVPATHHASVSRGIASERIKPLVHKTKHDIVHKTEKKKKITVVKSPVKMKIFGLNSSYQSNTSDVSTVKTVRSPANKNQNIEDNNDEGNHTGVYKQEVDRLMEELSNYRPEVNKN